VVGVDEFQEGQRLSFYSNGDGLGDCFFTDVYKVNGEYDLTL